MQCQNITLSVPKDILRKAKHLAIEKQTSVSGLLAKTLEDIITKDEAYTQAKLRQPFASMSRKVSTNLIWGKYAGGFFGA